MINQWIESVVIKRLVLALASAVAAHVAAHAVPDLTPILNKLALAGISVTIQVDADKLKNSLTILLFAASQGLHEWIAVKYPTLGKYL